MAILLELGFFQKINPLILILRCTGHALHRERTIVTQALHISTIQRSRLHTTSLKCRYTHVRRSKLTIDYDLENQPAAYIHTRSLNRARNFYAWARNIDLREPPCIVSQLKLDMQRHKNRHTHITTTLTAWRRYLETLHCANCVSKQY